jgi:hypothetical protein
MANDPMYIDCTCLVATCSYQSATRKEIKRHIRDVHNKRPQIKDYKVNRPDVIEKGWRSRLSHFLNRQAEKKQAEQQLETVRRFG